MRRLKKNKGRREHNFRILTRKKLMNMNEQTLTKGQPIEITKGD